MMSASEGYEFDIAVSFAGEDRELVHQIVDRIKSTGINVFYDSDYQAEMWGEDLVEYFDQIYRTRARYVMMFISRFYAEKMWTTHERRSAMARALEQRNAYILPIRLDSTPLKGLRPTVGYLDARQLGSDGIVSIALAKLKGAAPSSNVAISRVPRTEVERQQVLLMRPPGWEYLYFAGELLHEQDSVEGKYRDHEIHYAPANGEPVEATGIFTFMRRSADEAKVLSGKLTRLVTDEDVRERAFGPVGQPGDPQRLAHLAKRWNSVYEEFMDWATRIRGASAPSEFRQALELLARYVDGPVEQYRRFVDDYVAQVDVLPATFAAGETPHIQVHLTISIPDEVAEPFMAELDRLGEELETHNR